MKTFLNRYHILKLNQDQVNNLNRLITIQEDKSSYQKPSNQNNPGPNGFSIEVYQNFKDKLIPIVLKLFHTLETKGTLPNYFYEATVTLILKPHRDSTKKENCRPISLMNIDTKILNEILANQIQEHIRKIIHHDQVSFIP